MSMNCDERHRGTHVAHNVGLRRVAVGLLLAARGGCTGELSSRVGRAVVLRGSAALQLRRRDDLRDRRVCRCCSSTRMNRGVTSALERSIAASCCRGIPWPGAPCRQRQQDVQATSIALQVNLTWRQMPAH